ncbi:winged helix-turn-helix domain-containing protein, partial [Photobacterium minamisatsumaniensis]|uniref:winged helix-turn-helix domain-containing protein n=1 Tax=Photobacterium minamisatsumaniensis TaxID=2910233 RepID=UPI003D0C31C5
MMNDITYVTLKMEQCYVIVNKENFELHRPEMIMLDYFGMNRDKIVTKKELLDICWNGKVVSESSLYVSISRIRKKFSRCGITDSIVTVKGLGYKITSDIVISHNEEYPEQNECSVETNNNESYLIGSKSTITKDRLCVNIVKGFFIIITVIH